MYLLCEAFENVQAYGIATHRHTPEIEQSLSESAEEPITINFTPHLIPMPRGILATSYANLKPGVTEEQVDQAFQLMYGKEFFIRLLGRGGYPATKNTRGSNFCDIAWHIDPRTKRVIVLSALDNLVKGAAGQAVQNMNVMMGLDEKAGLTQAPLYP
jgi:N-acetyl-gamma-glutamyl-phosphate reductase